MEHHPVRQGLYPRFAHERVALEAMRYAASRLRIAPEELRATQYRALRSSLRESGLPEHTAIRTAFGSWERARERAAARPTDV